MSVSVDQGAEKIVLNERVISLIISGSECLHLFQCLHLFRSRRQAGEIEGGPADQSARVSGRSGIEADRHLDCNERINAIPPLVFLSPCLPVWLPHSLITPKALRLVLPVCPLR